MLWAWTYGLLMWLNCGFYMEYILCATLLDCLLECFMDLYLWNVLLNYVCGNIIWTKSTWTSSCVFKWITARTWTFKEQPNWNYRGSDQEYLWIFNTVDNKIPRFNVKRSQLILVNYSTAGKRTKNMEFTIYQSPLSTWRENQPPCPMDLLLNTYWYRN